MRFPVFDLHCDTALALLGENYDARGSLRHNNLHIDLERAGENEGYVQCFACFTSPAYTSKVSPQQLFERQLLNLLEQLEMNKDRISLAYRAKDIQKNLQSKKASAILTIEGPAGFGYDIALLEAGGLKIAMGNATEELKEIADYITESVYDDGFVCAMEKFCLG